MKKKTFEDLHLEIEQMGFEKDVLVRVFLRASEQNSSLPQKVGIFCS